jgi:hypothetical protein
VIEEDMEITDVHPTSLRDGPLVKPLLTKEGDHVSE